MQQKKNQIKSDLFVYHNFFQDLWSHQSMPKIFQYLYVKTCKWSEIVLMKCAKWNIIAVIEMWSSFLDWTSGHNKLKWLQLMSMIFWMIIDIVNYSSREKNIRQRRLYVLSEIIDFFMFLFSLVKKRKKKRSKKEFFSCFPLDCLIIQLLSF